jgi:hypothetical protein
VLTVSCRFVAATAFVSCNTTGSFGTAAAVALQTALRRLGILVETKSNRRTSQSVHWSGVSIASNQHSLFQINASLIEV